MKNTTVKKSLILVVALLLCATVVLAACTESSFTPVSVPSKGQVEGNGGIAVKYGEWLYYINGYASATSAVNTYSDEVKDAPRVGSVVRIKLADLQGLFDIQDESNKTSSQKTEESEQYVRDHAETVVPKFYYNGSTDSSTIYLNGLYIFGDRLYITTPNDELTAGGDALTSQLVLTSFDLGGGSMQRHFVFTSNSVQLAYKEEDGKLCATYVMDSKIYTLTGLEKLAEATSTEVTVNGTDEAADIDNTYSSITWDLSEGRCIFFIDKMYNLCKLAIGSDKYDVVVANGTAKVHGDGDDKHIEAPDTSADGVTYSINSVNFGQVYYTKTQLVSDPKIYWAESATKGGVALNTGSTDVRAWKDGKMISTKAAKDGSFYGVYIISSPDGSNTETVLVPAANKNAITVDRIVGDTLYYTKNSVKYTLSLNERDREAGAPYAKNLASASGWATPDFVDYDATETVHYIVTASSGGLTVAKFDPSDPDKTQTSVSILLQAKAEEDE